MSEGRPGTTGSRTYEQRVADAGPLRVDLWAAVKSARDDALSRMLSAQAQYEEMNALLKRMKAAGLSDHLPTLEEAQEAWRRMTQEEATDAE